MTTAPTLVPADPFAGKTAFEEANPDAERKGDFEPRAVPCNCCDCRELLSAFYRVPGRGTLVVWECPECHDHRVI